MGGMHEDVMGRQEPAWDAMDYIPPTRTRVPLLRRPTKFSGAMTTKPVSKLLRMGAIEPSMWLRVDCVNSFGIAFEHDGIVVGVSDPADSTKIEVVHFAWSEPAERRVIVITTLQSFLAMGANARVVAELPSFSPEKVVARARSQLGRADYHLFGRNCQHFAHWCYLGSAFSRQIFKLCAFGTAFGLVVVVAGTMGMAAARGGMW